MHQLIINQCTLEERHSEVRCNCTDIIKTSAKLNVNKKEAKPEVEVGDQDAADGKVKGKYKGNFPFLLLLKTTQIPLIDIPFQLYS